MLIGRLQFGPISQTVAIMSTISLGELASKYLAVARSTAFESSSGRLGHALGCTLICFTCSKHSHACARY
jgi:hypothetical protein